MDDNNKLRDTILDMEASLSTNLNGYSMWHYGADIHGITRETLKNAVEALKAQEAVKPKIYEGERLIPDSIRTGNYYNAMAGYARGADGCR